MSIISNKKHIPKLEYEKFGHSFSEPVSLQNTPQSIKAVKLGPLEPSVSDKRTIEPRTPPGKNPKSQFSSISPTIFRTSQKAWPSPNENKQSPNPFRSASRNSSKFANSLMDSIEHGKHYRKPPSSLRYKRNEMEVSRSFSKDLVHNSYLSSPRENEEKHSNLLKIQTDRAPLVFSNINTKRKTFGKILIVSQSHSDEMMSEVRQSAKDLNAFTTHPYRHFIFGPQPDLEAFKKHLLMIHKGLSYSIKSLKNPSEKFIRSKQVSLCELGPKKSKVLLLDLDETLIHTCLLRNNPDAVLNYQAAPGEPYRQLPIKIRPHLKEFFAKLSPHYEIAIFTASAMTYAQTIINYIDKDKQYISTILSRENCMETRNGFYIKDLRIIRGRDLKDVVLVDNLLHSFGFQLENGVPILEFIDNRKDEELKHLATYLLEACKYEDIRQFNKEKLRLKEIADAKLDDLLNSFTKL